ncbi:uncharacterized protein PSFLO_07253 [Pseudozyma flocculosa]|uniref:triacylglycerol lipase n=2 Tax=Pseudozyma flocculosa TaxID=84751 RepID=A0A5C3FE67_9BASI|nr:uncharacterized protein PSFLO_07253 [Pseudozyma flocculosa]
MLFARLSSTFACLAVALLAGTTSAGPVVLERDDASSANSLANITSSYQAFVKSFRNTTLVDDVFTAEFYQTPSTPSLADSKPGTILRIEKVTGGPKEAKFGQLPEGSTLWRINYVSVDYQNKHVPATGFVLAPYVKSNKTVAWAHGTSGITRECAPSDQAQLYYGWRAVFQLVAQGYNVVAPDYAGQGSDTQFNYVEAVTHAYDVTNAVAAAKSAIPELNIDKWAVVGHSEGGMTAWSTTEYQSGLKTSDGFLGGVSLAPSMNPREINARTLATTESRALVEQQGSVFYTINVFESIRRIFPTLSRDRYLTDLGKKYLDLYLAGGCFPAATMFFGSIKVDSLWKDYTWPTAREALQWAKLIKSEGRARLTKPLLVLQGDMDEAVWPTINHETFDAHCKKFDNKSPIQFVFYKNVLHAPIIHAGSPRWFAFLEDLFANRKPRDFSHCKTLNVTGVEQH